MFKSLSVALIVLAFVGSCFGEIAQSQSKSQQSAGDIQNNAQKSQDSQPKQPELSQNSQPSKQVNDAQASAVLSQNIQPSGKSSPNDNDAQNMQNNQQSAPSTNQDGQQSQNSQQSAPSTNENVQQGQNRQQSAPSSKQAAQQGQNIQQSAPSKGDEQAQNSQQSSDQIAQQGQNSQQAAPSTDQAAQQGQDGKQTNQANPLSKVLLRQNGQQSGPVSSQANDAQQMLPQSDESIQKFVTFNNAALKAEAQKQVKQLLIKKSTSNDAAVEKCLARYKMNVGAGVRCEQANPKQAVKCSPYNKQLVLTPFPGILPTVVANSPEECASRASCCALVAESYNSVTEFCGCNAPAPPPLEKENKNALGKQ